MGLGSAMAGGNSSEGRVEDDFYPTPHGVTQALLKIVSFRGVIHEPCCGDGAMTRVLEDAGHKVVASDINPRGSGVARDFFTITKPVGHNIVTNPPFKIAVRMIEHGLTLNPQVMAMVLKSTFWHARNRRDLFERTQPAMICPLLWRPDFLGLGRPTMEVMWCIWKKGHTGPPSYHLLPKPE